jgi:hypothetical protein
MRPLAFFKDCRLARMSDGHYCLLRDLGPVKGAKGMKHHEVVIDFSRRGLLVAFRRLTVEKVAGLALMAETNSQVQSLLPQ